MNDAKQIGALIAEAFDELAPAHWIVPDSTVRKDLLAGHFEILADHALEHGAVHLTDDGNGVAVWFDNTQPDPPAIDGYDKRLAAAVGDWLGRFQAFDAALEAHHPHEPHYHLALLAVRPGHRKLGVGSRLLERHHEWLDDRGISAYLEASSLRVSELYVRHGYQPLGIPYNLPDGGPPMFPMWRKAH